MSNFNFLNPFPKEINVNDLDGTLILPHCVRINNKIVLQNEAELLSTALMDLTNTITSPDATYTITLKRSETMLKNNKEGYSLDITEEGVVIQSYSNKGVFNGIQTLLQLILLYTESSLPTLFIRESLSKEIPLLSITDWPDYEMRSFMIDLGRSIYSLAYLKQIVRILASIKMNTLHLHLSDDHLNGLRLNNLPLGSENPYALTLSELQSLIQYAKTFHVEIIPEIECWGHAASYIYHYPELYGCSGMHGGMSFGMGEETFDLFEKVFDELIPILDDKAHLHVGLDEAKWELLANVSEENKKNYSPELLVERLYKIIKKLGEKYNKEVTMHLWADHGGRPIPEYIREHVVVQPWFYFECSPDEIDKKVEHIKHEKGPVMLGAGMSNWHFGGHFGATKLWSQAGAGEENIKGLTICMWQTNNLPDRLIGLYRGAHYAWSTEDFPVPSLMPENDSFNEVLYGRTTLEMMRWQAAFKDGDEESLTHVRGPEVRDGRYCWGENAGAPVAPTVDFMNTKEAAIEKPPMQ